MCSSDLAEVCAVAKKDLAVGEKLDQIGEYCYRAWIMEAVEAKEASAIPCGILAGSVVTRSEERRVGKECRSRWSPYH